MLTADQNTPSETPKRGHSQVTAASPDSEMASPDGKQARAMPALLELDLKNSPGKDASAGEWGAFLVKQLTIMNKNIHSIATSSEFANDQAADALSEIAKTNLAVGNITKTMSGLVVENDTLKRENTDLKEKMLSLESYARRNNLVFDGIREEPGETDFHVYGKIVDVLNYIPEFNGIAHNIRISRCHRVGPYIPNRTRSIIAHFHWFGDRQAILRLKKQLPHGIYVNEDFPSEINDRRRALRPILQYANSKPELRGQVKMPVDKLIYKHKVYTVAPINNLHELPDEINLSKCFEREDDNVVAFLGPGTALSNFAEAPFKLDNVLYKHNEQFVVKEKAEMFGDDFIAQKAMKETNPFLIQSLGKRIRNFDEQRWKTEGPAIVKRGALEKFRQNPSACQRLLDTGNKTIIEASKNKFWGVGMKMTNPGILEPSQWVGDNAFGSMLMDVRAILRAERATIQALNLE